LVSEEVGVAGLAGAGLAGKDSGERDGGLAAGLAAGLCAGFVRSAGGQTLKCGLNGGEVVEGEEAVGATAKLAGGLRAAEHEEAEDGSLVAAEVENGADAVLVLGDAAVADGGGKGEVFQGVEGLADLVFAEVENGIAARTLVARVDEGIEGEGIVLRRGDLFFDEGAEDAELDRVELHVYKVPQVRPLRWADNEGPYAD
jgi:hypothetical protein